MSGKCKVSGIYKKISRKEKNRKIIFKKTNDGQNNASENNNIYVRIILFFKCDYLY